MHQESSGHSDAEIGSFLAHVNVDPGGVRPRPDQPVATADATPLKASLSDSDFHEGGTIQVHGPGGGAAATIAVEEADYQYEVQSLASRARVARLEDGRWLLSVDMGDEVEDGTVFPTLNALATELWREAPEEVGYYDLLSQLGLLKLVPPS